MIRFIAILSMCLLHISVSFFPSTLLELIFKIMTVIVFLLVIPSLNIKRRVFTLFLFFGGVIVHYSVGVRGIHLFDGITQNLSLLSILILAPLLSIPLKREGIIETIVTYLTKLKNEPKKIFLGISTFMLTVSPILNMGAIRIVHGFVENIYIPPKVLSRAYFTGFTPAVSWSPFFASVGIVLFYLDITYLSYVGVGLIFALIQSIIGIFLFYPRVKLQGEIIQIAQPIKKIKNLKRDIVIMISFIFGLVLLLILLEKLVEKSMLILVSLICIVVPIVWSIIRKKLSVLKEEIFLFKQKLLIQSNTEISLFLGAGIFGNAISQTPLIGYLDKGIQWSATLSVGILFLFIILFVTLMAVLGVHQIIVIPLVLGSLIAANVDITTNSIAFMCIYTWMVSSAISPVNAMNVIISQCVQKDGITVGLKWNGLYFSVITLVAFIFVYVLNSI